MASSFLKNISVLVFGAGVAQLVPLVFLPLLTRVYDPESFGLLALYVSIVSIFGVVVCGRYEQAIMLPEKENDALSLCRASILIAFTVSSLIYLTLLIFDLVELDLLNAQGLSSYIYLLPISVFFLGVTQVFIVWNNRTQNYKGVASARVLQSSSQTISQVILGILSFPGLVLGQALGTLSGAIYFLLVLPRDEKLRIFRYDSSNSLKVLKEYNRFPKYGIAGSLSDVLALQMPVLLISRFFDTVIVGYFSLTFKVLSLPASLLSTALSQVLYQRIAVAYETNKQGIAPMILKAAFFLLLLFVPIALSVGLYGRPIFVFVFGEEWEVAGEIAQIIVFAVGIRFVVSPLSVVMSLGNYLTKATLWQFSYLITVSTTLMLFSSEGILELMIAFTLHEILLYSIYFVLIYSSALSIGKVECVE